MPSYRFGRSDLSGCRGDAPLPQCLDLGYPLSKPVCAEEREHRAAREWTGHARMGQYKFGAGG